jgi:hypothetical protein
MRYQNLIVRPLLAGTLMAVLLLGLQRSALSQTNIARPDGIKLNNGWDLHLHEGSATLDELERILTPCGQPIQNLAPNPGIEIFNGVTYLMPVRQAIKVLKLPSMVGAKKPITCPGFPHQTLWAYVFHYPQGGTFNEIYVVVDRGDQVVAIELYSPKSLLPVNFSRKEHTYSFVSYRIKAQNPTCVVGHSITTNKDAILVESAFQDLNRGANTRCASKLYLPQPMIDLILYRIQNIRRFSKH